jgi:hypothetical protein
MTKQIEFYLSGMIQWNELGLKDQVWVFVNQPKAVPAGAMLFMLGQ